MGYSKLPLQDIFLAVSQTTISPVRDLYAHLAKRLQAGVTNFVQVWEEEIAHIQPHTALKESELDIMRQFGQSLGQHTFTQQQKQITLTIHHLQRILDEAEEQRYKYERMMKTLGVLVGIFVVLLIF